jgi:hypothetical protein
MVVEMEFLRDSRISQESGNVNGEIFAINIEVNVDCFARYAL